MAFPTGWGYKQKLTIQNAKIPGTLSSFPVVITRSELHNDIVDPSGSNNAQADGGDIRFSADSAGTNQIACEIVSFEHDTTTGAGDASIEIHIIITSVSSSVDTDFYIWYNTAGTDSQPAATATYGSENVWDSDFLEVYHMQETTGVMVNSNGGNDGTVNGTPSRGVAGPFGAGGCDFDGTDDYIGLTALSATETGWTVEHWCNPDALDEFAVSYNTDAGGWNDDILLGVAPEGDTITTNDRWAVVSQDSTDSLRTISTDTADAVISTWYYVAATADTTDLILYIDDKTPVSTTKTGTALDHGTQGRKIGEDNNDINRDFNGQIDEFRFSTITRSSDWLDATYNNQNSPSTFIVDSTPTAIGGSTTMLPFRMRY